MKTLILSTLLLALGGQTAPPATDAQKLLDAQAENQKLREELDAARRRIKQLEAAAGQAAPAAAPVPAEAAADVMGNPIAVLDFFRKKFAEDMTKKRVALPQEKDAKATRQAYLAKAKEWIDAMNRTTYSVEWRGRVTSLGAAKGVNQDIQYQCVAADNKRTFGRPFPVTLLKSSAPQLGSELTDPDAIWILSGTLEPALSLAPDLLQPNTFDNPPLAGPCVAFKFQVKVQRLYLEKDAAAPPAKAN